MLQRKDLATFIKTNDTKELANIVNELSSIKHKIIDKDKELSLYEQSIIKSYHNITIQYYKRIFEDKSTCDISNGLDKTVPYQVGLIKAYSQMILKG